MGPTLKKRYEKQTRKKKPAEAFGGERNFLKKILSSFLSQIHENLTSDFVEINTESALRDEGYAWVPETRDFTENSGKNSENPKFLVFLRFTAF